MSLQARFALLFSMLGVAALVSVVAALWSFQVISREVREPFRDMSTVLRLLSEAKGHVEQAGSVLNRTRVDGGEDASTASDDVVVDQGVRPGPEGSPREPLAADERHILFTNLDAFSQTMERLEGLESAAMVSGKATLANIRRRYPAARLDIVTWLEHAPKGEDDAGTLAPEAVDQSRERLRRAAAMELYRLHNLIERIEQQIIASAEVTLQHSQDMRSRLLSILGLALLTGALCILLGVFLVRRWVLRPVADLRVAAARIASGDFVHRVPVSDRPGTDELALLSVEVNHMSSMVKSLQDERVERERLAALGEMVRRIVHNLRNPLAGIRGLAELSKSDLVAGAGGGGGGGLTPAAQMDVRENQDRIIASVDRFERWLADLLRATRPAEIHVQDCAVREWLEHVAEPYRASATARHVDLIVDASGAPERAIIDPGHLEHALGAIIANAIDAASTPRAESVASVPHTASKMADPALKTAAASHFPPTTTPPSDPAKARAWVRVTARGGDGLHARSGQQAHRDAAGALPASHWELCVSDSGPGIPPEMHERIFAPYFTTKREGTGIGLATALQVVRAHGGRIVLDSAQNASSSQDFPSPGLGERLGASFRVVLPIEPDVAKDRQVARIGQTGVPGGQDSDHRR